MRSIGCRTQLCAVIGNPVGHSLSPAIHNAAYEALDLDFVYVACPVEDVKGALAGATRYTWRCRMSPTRHLPSSIDPAICQGGANSHTM